MNPHRLLLDLLVQHLSENQPRKVNHNGTRRAVIERERLPTILRGNLLCGLLIFFGQHKNLIIAG